MRGWLFATVYAVGVLLVGYLVGTLLGAAFDHTRAGKGLGLIIGAVALVAWFRQPDPGRAGRLLARYETVVSGRMIPVSPYLNAAALVVVVFVLIVVWAGYGAFIVWFLS